MVSTKSKIQWSFSFKLNKFEERVEKDEIEGLESKINELKPRILSLQPIPNTQSQFIK